MKRFLIMTLFFSTFANADIEISNERIRAVAPGQKMTGAFMNIKNTGSDLQLISAESTISKAVELHTHVEVNEVMRMRKVDAIDLPSNTITHLKPGGLHIMFIGLASHLKIDQKVDVTLVFSNDSRMQLAIPVKAIMPNSHGKMGLKNHNN